MIVRLSSLPVIVKDQNFYIYCNDKEKREENHFSLEDLFRGIINFGFTLLKISIMFGTFCYLCVPVEDTIDERLYLKLSAPAKPRFEEKIRQMTLFVF